MRSFDPKLSARLDLTVWQSERSRGLRRWFWMCARRLIEWYIFGGRL